VAEPEEYQRELLALLGGEDPVTVLAATATLLRERLGDVPADQLARRPQPDEWSPAELLGTCGTRRSPTPSGPASSWPSTSPT
jgi:hypothetical protein